MFFPAVIKYLSSLKFFKILSKRLKVHSPPPLSLKVPRSQRDVPTPPTLTDTLSPHSGTLPPPPPPVADTFFWKGDNIVLLIYYDALHSRLNVKIGNSNNYP